MDDVVKIVKDLLKQKFSGGAKFMELLPDLVAKLEDKTRIFEDSEKVIEELKNSLELRVVTYYWPINETELRTKHFIYLNL